MNNQEHQTEVYAFSLTDTDPKLIIGFRGHAAQDGATGFVWRDKSGQWWGTFEGYENGIGFAADDYELHAHNRDEAIAALTEIYNFDPDVD